MPILEKEEFTNKLPKEYWDLYNEGETLYKQKQYLKAKKTFLKISNFTNPHQAYHTSLLRTFRKIIKEEIDEENFNEAYKTFLDLFKFCSNDFTNTDIKKFNKITNKLSKMDPNSNFQEIEILDEPDIKISSSDDKFIHLTNETRFNKDNDSRIKDWNILTFMEYNTLYATSEYESSFYKVRNYTGNLRSEFTANHSIYRFNHSENSDKFLVGSDNIILYLYSINNGLIASYDLNSVAEDKYHMRCIDISPEGNFLLFTNVDKAYLMNSDSDTIGSWKMPIKEMSKEDGWELRKYNDSISHSEITRNLAILDLDGNPEYSEIKKKFKGLVLKYHPDQNPNNESTDKIKEIITAYEYLTQENAKGALKETGMDEYYYYKVMSKTEFEIPNTDLSFTLEMGMGNGITEDWIYATYLDLNGEEIYLGCYSGKIYCLTPTGIVKKLYDCHDVVRSIKKIEPYLFIETDYYLYILKNDKYLNNLKIWKKGDLFWMNGTFFLKTSNELKFFSYDGILKSTINFKNRIYDFYITNKGFNVSTTNRTYEILVNIQDESIAIENVSSNIPCTYCGTENLYYSIFCQECGKAIKINQSPKKEKTLKQRTEIFCPYCNESLEQEPKKKKKCPHCKNFIYVRTSPSTRKKILVTEEGTKEIEKEWKKYHNKSHCLRNLKSYGVKDEDFKLHKNKLSNDLGHEPDDSDVISSIYDDLILKNNDIQTLKMIHYTIALYFNSEGKDYIKPRQESSRMELLSYQQLGVNEVEIMTAGEQSCKNCQKLENKIFKISDALKIMPIPCKDCNYQLYNENKGFCRCSYSPKIIY